MSEINEGASQEGAPDITCPSILLARRLKSYTINEEGTQVVSDYNHELLKKKCIASSPDYDPQLDLNIIFKELFKCNEKWADRSLIYKSMELFGKVQGWKPKLTNGGTAIACNRIGQKDYKRDYSAGALKQGCTLILKVSAEYSIKKATKKPKDNTKEAKMKSRPDFSRATYIREGIYDHGGGCRPSSQNLVAVNERTGVYQRGVTSSKMYQLCNMAENGKLDSAAIKQIIEPIMPNQKGVTKWDVYSIKKKVTSYLPTLRENPEYESFCEHVNDSELLDGIDNEIDMDDDEINKMAKDCWLDSLQQSRGDKRAALSSLLEYMALLRERCKGFDYELAYDTDGDLIGIVWQTATMRDNYERFGGYISLDSMKRGINKWLWPYMAVVMYNEMKNVCLGCEGIMIGEKEGAYNFMCKFLIEKSPGRDAEDVNVVAGDGFFGQELISQFGFTKAKFVTDWHHLFKDGLTDHFGERGCAHIKSSLLQMIKAKSEEFFDQALANAKTTLANLPEGRDLQLEKKLDEFANMKWTYAAYCLDQIKGTKGLHGSSMSEQNHSSVLCYLNNGRQGINEYCEELFTLIKDLFGRQQVWTKKFNKKLYDENTHMLNKIEELLQKEKSAINIDLIKAAKVLCKMEFERYHANRKRAEMLQMSESDDGKLLVRCIENPTADPRVFDSVDDDCDCEERVAFEGQCPHLIKVRGGFDITCFEKRHIRRKKVVGSINGWTPPPPSTEFGGDEEVMDSATSDPFQDMIDNNDYDDINMEVAVPPEAAQIDLSSTEVKPLRRKGISDLTTKIISHYDGCSDDVKFVIGGMFVQIKKLAMGGVKNADNMQSEGDVLNATREIVELYQSAFKAPSGEFISGKVSGEPSASTVSRAPKKRVMKAKEAAMVAQNKKRKQDVSGVAMGVKVNAPRTEQRCGFCKKKGRHTIQRCDRREHFKKIGVEYNVANPNESTALVDRLLSSPPSNNMASQPSSVVSRLSTEQLKSSYVIIHQKYAVSAGSVASINNFAFVISIIVGGEVDLNAQNIQISGSLMNQIISNVSLGNRPTPKFIYDATVPISQPICQPMMMNMSQPMIGPSQLSQQEMMPALPACPKYGVNDYGMFREV